MPQMTIADALDWLTTQFVLHGPDTPLWLEVPPVRPQLDTVTRQRLTATARDCLRHGACLCEVVRSLKHAGYLPLASTLIPVQGLRIMGPVGNVVVSGENGRCV